MQPEDWLDLATRIQQHHDNYDALLLPTVHRYDGIYYSVGLSYLLYGLISRCVLGRKCRWGWLRRTLCVMHDALTFASQTDLWCLPGL